MHYKNLVDALTDRAAKDGEIIGINFIDKPDDSHFVSYSALYRRAAGILYNLQNRGLKPGAPLVFQLDNNQDFAAVFWGCLMGKIIPVPVTLGTHPELRLKLFKIWQVLERPYLITYKKHLDVLESFAKDKKLAGVFKDLQEHTLLTEGIAEEKGEGTICMSQESDTAFIQFSSGSTGSPKGVVLTHKNLLTNIKAMLLKVETPGFDKCFSWMPLTHDMGIIGFHLVPLVSGWDHGLMATPLFIRYPELWLQKTAETKSTLTSSPNFGYQYVLKHFTPEKYRGVDLSCVRLIFNGAEPISAQLCNQFLDQMAPFGLKRTAMFPVYGLAEASLAVTFPKPQEEIVFAHYDRKALKIGEKVKEQAEGANSVSFVEVGRPVNDCFLKIVDEKGNECGDRVIGHIMIKGGNVTSGYYRNPEANAETITPAGWLRTGDLGFFRNGRLVITGRAKDILFAKGANYYPHDIERVAEDLEEIGFDKIAVSGVYNEEMQSDEIICFVVFKRKLKDFLPLAAALRDHIAEEMGIEIGKIIPVKKIPKTTSGKTQRYKLRQEYLEGMYNPVIRELADLQHELNASKTPLTRAEIRKIVIETWKQVLGTDNVGEYDNFFECGGDSARAVRIKSKLQEVLGRVIDDVAMFKYSTIDALTDYLSASGVDGRLSAAQGEYLGLFGQERRRIRERIKKFIVDETGKTEGRNGWEVAVIGMSGRFPGAHNIDEFWDNTKNGVESISFFSDEELIEGGVDPQLLDNPDYVKVKGVLDDIELFDAAFFGYTPQEAGEMDPQVRIFHECLWEALEDAGYDPGVYKGSIGVYAGATPNPAWDSRSIMAGKTSASAQFTDTQLADKDFMTTRISYKMDLKGPSFTMYTACSTSLVAIDLACQGLLTGKCDMALAGGVSIWLPHKTGYLYEEAMLFSRDGHNRTFDEQVSGTVFSDGVGIVVLKRLEEALTDGDHIYAVVKGSAVNNDGNRKAGYTAPALLGQAEVIAAAQQMAGVEPESIGYVEAHGTATTLGDPIEIEALNLAFNTQKKEYCALGSVKSNIGHLNSAAGVAGFIKTVLSLYHRLIPPSLHFQRSNPRIDFDRSPFYVNTQLKEWEKNDIYPSAPRRAGVSSFGIGGTNAHAVLEEAPRLEESSVGREWKMLMLSARTKESLDNATENFVKYLKKHPVVDLADVAYTLQVGRRHFQYRKMLVCSHRENAIEMISTPDSGKVYTADVKNQAKSVVFMFSGQGSQYVNMGLGLYQGERVFREEMDACFNIFQSIVGYDLKALLYPSENPAQEAAARIKKTEITQPLIFMFEYALAKLLLSWGIKPEIMIGYSFGEYTAACLAGVFSLEDSIKLVVLRGRLMQKMPKGGMLSVPLPVKKLKPFLSNKLSIAIDNGSSCIVSGTNEAIDAFEKELKGKGYLSVRVSVSHAGHSSLMTPILMEFEKELRNTTLNAPAFPFISNVSAKTITADEATDPQYWVRHLKDTVRFGEGIGALLKTPNVVFVEIGPGQDLCVLVKSHEDYTPDQRLVNLIRHEKKAVPDLYYLLNRVGHLWLYGVDIDWGGFYSDEKRRRVSLPTYNFQYQHFPVNVDNIHLKAGIGKDLDIPLQKIGNIDQWFYIPSWKRSRLPEPVDPRGGDGQMGRMMLFMDEVGLGSKIEMQLKQHGYQVSIIRCGREFARVKEDEYTVNPLVTDDYEALIEELKTSGHLPHTILHLWSVTSTGGEQPGIGELEEELDRGYYSLIALAQALGKLDSGQQFQLKVVSNNAQDVVGGDLKYPGKATLVGPVKVIGQEFSSISCCLIDIVLPESAGLVDHLVQECKLKILDDHNDQYGDKDTVIAYRNHHRWIQTFEPVKMKKNGGLAAGLREGGVYLITGGLGGMGLILAEHLAGSVKAKLVLTDRFVLPERDEWDGWLSSHPTEDKTSDKIRKIRELETLGAEVMVSNADVANEAQMQQVVFQAQQRFGPLNGVIHAAGIPDGAMILRRTRELSEEVLIPKVTGTLVIYRLLKDCELDFFIFCSSMASILPLPGQVAYAAANAFLDAFAAGSVSKSGVTPVSINWDRWQNVGVSVIAEKKHRELWGEDMEEGITPAEGIEVFGRILVDPLPRVLVSPIDLDRMVDRFNVPRLLSAADTPGGQPPSKTLHRRPELSVSYVEPGNELERKLAEIWQELLGIDRVGIHDNFFELGGDSLKGMKFVNRYNTLLDEIVHINVIFEASTIAELADYFVKNYPKAVATVTGTEITPDASTPDRRINIEIIERVRHSVPPPVPCSESQTSRNPPALFILSPPRSGTTLLRVMLAGHPRLFAPPELGLLSHNTLDQVDFTLQSSVRSLMEINRCGVEEAQRKIREFQQQQMTTKQFYRLLQEGIGRRMLVDKTPHYTLSLDVLKRAEIYFENSLYIHLMRHPYGMIRSFEEARLDLLYGDQSIHEMSLSRRELAEAIWYISHQNIIEFLKDIPQGRQHWVKFEDLVREPGKSMERICRFLSLQFHREMLQPYKEKKQRMTDSIHSEGRMMGDVKFNRHKRIDPGVADNWRKYYHTDFLADVTWEIAESFHYKPIKSDRLSIEPTEKKEYYPTTVAQKKFFIINQFEGINETYNTFRYVPLEGKLDRARFEEAWRALIRRQESLRTSFHLIEGQPVMKVHETVDFQIEYAELVEQENRENEMQEIIKKFRTTFDLSQPPLMRVKLVSMDRENLVMLFGMHHIITDGYSMEIIFEELAALYGGNDLPSLNLQYRDYALWQQKFLESSQCKEQEAYWLERFPGEIPLLNMPTDYPRPKVQRFEGEWVHFRLEKQVLHNIQKLAEDTGTTLYMILLAALNVLLSRYTGQKDIIVGSPIAGRDREELESVIGVFMNVAPMRNLIEEDKSFESFLGKVKQNVLMAFENHQYPLGMLVEKLGIIKDLSRNPLNDVELIMVRNNLSLLEVEGLRFVPNEFNVGTSPVDITVAVVESDNGFSFTLMYCTNLFKRETIDRFIDSFKEILMTVTQNKDILVKDIAVSTGLGEAVAVFQDNKGDFGF